MGVLSISAPPGEELGELPAGSGGPCSGRGRYHHGCLAGLCWRDGEGVELFRVNFASPLLSHWLRVRCSGREQAARRWPAASACSSVSSRASLPAGCERGSHKAKMGLG